MQKAGLVELVDDDRATLLDAFLGLVDQLQDDDGTSPADLIARWRRRGLRAFDANKEPGAVLGRKKEDGRPEADDAR